VPKTHPTGLGALPTLSGTSSNPIVGRAVTLRLPRRRKPRFADTWHEVLNNGAFDGWHQIGGSDTHYSVVGVGDFSGTEAARHIFSTHSLRRTKATLIYRRTGNLRAVQLLLGHKKMESTVRYLGIEVDDALAIAEQVEV